MRAIAGVIVAGSLLAGCARPRAAEPEPAPDAFGQYRFLAEPGPEVRLTGVLLLTPDTVVPQPTTSTCKLASDQSSRDHLLYDCPVPGTSTLQLSLHRRSPLRRSTWLLVTPVRRTRQSCIAWQTWENGTRSCKQSAPEEYIEHVRRSGVVVVSR